MNKELQSGFQKLFDNNEAWVDHMINDNPRYFEELSKGQKPDYLWIGCSDSRVPANEITGTAAGEIFVHRNIANMCVHSDMNMLSVLDYAVNKLMVKHIIVAGHYNCGGISAALAGKSYGIIDNWLRHIKDVYRLHKDEIDALPTEESRRELLVELNAKEQMFNLAKTSIVQEAWKNGRDLAIHAIVVDLKTGRLKNLNISMTNAEKLDDLYDIVDDLNP